MLCNRFVTEVRKPWIALAAIAGFVAGVVVQTVPFMTTSTARADGHSAKADPAAFHYTDEALMPPKADQNDNFVEVFAAKIPKTHGAPQRATVKV